MSYQIDLQNVCNYPFSIPDNNLITWATLPLSTHLSAAEITLRLVDKEEIQHLNSVYRKKDKPTNVLAFPANLPPYIQQDCPFVGDVIICPEVLKLESEAQEISIDAHYAHIIIHGVLHLLGYDHLQEEDTNTMQHQEITLLEKLNFSNPYYRLEDYYIE